MPEEATTLGIAQVPIRANLDDLDKDLKSLQGGLDKRLGGLAKGIGQTLGKVLTGGVAAGAAAIAGVGTIALKAGGEVDAAYDIIEQGTGKTGAALDGLKTAFQGVFTSVPTDAATAADAITELNRRLGLTGEPLQMVSAQLIRMSDMLGTDVTSTAGQFARVLGDWGVGNEQASATMDMLFKATQASGVSLDSLMNKMVQYGSPMRLMGFTIEDSVAMLSKWEKEGVNTELVLGSLRIAAGKFARDGKPLRESLLDTIKVIQGADSASDALALGMEVFGARAGPDMVAAIREGRFSLDELQAALANSKGAILDTAEATDDWPEKWKLVKNKAIVALTPIGLKLMDLGSMLLDKVMPYIDRLGVLFDTKIAPAIEPVVSGLETLAGAFGALFSGDMEGFGERASAGLYMITDALGIGREAVQPWIDGFVNLTQTIGTFIQEQVIPFVTEHAEALKAAILGIAAVVAGAAIVGGIASIVGGIASISAALNPVTLIISGIAAAVALLAMAWTEDWGGIRTWMTEFWTNTLQPIFQSIGQWMSVNIPAAIAVLSTFWTDTLLPALQAVWAFLSENVFPLFQALGELLDAVVQLAFQALAGLITEVVVPALKKVWSWMGDIATAISEELGPKLSWLKDHLFEPLGDRMGKIADLFQKLTGKIQQFTDKIKGITLPDWLTPGSPTPFELGLRGINSAMAALTRQQLPAFEMALSQGMYAEIALGGDGWRGQSSQTYNQQRYDIAVNVQGGDVGEVKRSLREVLRERGAR